MNILITAGLLVLAVVAIIGAILLGMDENRAKREPKDNISGHTHAAALPLAGVGAMKQPDGMAITPPIPATPVLAQTTDKLLALKKPKPQDSLAGLDGQVQEIAGEVRALAQHAGELEKRLHHLSELLERAQQRPFGTTTDQYSLPETDTQPH